MGFLFLKWQFNAGERKSEPVTVRTPACREHARAPRKRKCVYDDPIVAPNGVYGTWVSNASDLVRKRRTPAADQEKEQLSFDYLLQPIILKIARLLPHKDQSASNNGTKRRCSRKASPNLIRVLLNGAKAGGCRDL
ncbi:hypothetical protein SSX86_004286 [Deinandra increscens subsp. villosa]|uniref:Uncharacterized protein n=1 Tax=Deinandra increscens subsp. villosa TaxID=3103831 RepID=A0AAP0DIY6_9ASTR